MFGVEGSGQTQTKMEGLVIVVVMIVIMIVIMFVPITVGVPAVSIFVPPAMIVIPAIGASFRELMTPFVGFWTLIAVLGDGLVKFVVSMDGALLAIIVRTKRRRADKHKRARKNHRGTDKTKQTHKVSPVHVL